LAYKWLETFSDFPKVQQNFDVPLFQEQEVLALLMANQQLGKKQRRGVPVGP